MYKETKKQRFDKVSVARTQKIIDMIRLLGNCSNKNNYSYDEKDAMMLFQQIENALDDARACFNFSKTKSSMDKYKEIFETEYTWLKGFMRNVDRYGNKSAMFFPLENKQWTYSELNVDANKFANALIRNGIRKRDVIFCQMKNSPEFVFGYIASHKIGSVFAPINYRLAPAETAELIKKSKPEVIMIDKCLEEDIKKAMEPMYTSKPDKGRSGMGFSFMEAFMDELAVESEPGKGTTVKMKKKVGNSDRETDGE